MAHARMTQAEFDALRPSLGRMALDTIAVARLVLVEGVTPAEVATTQNMSRQRIHGILHRFAAAAQNLPTGWRRVEVWLPPNLADQVENLADQARIQWNIPNKNIK